MGHVSLPPDYTVSKAWQTYAVAQRNRMKMRLSMNDKRQRHQGGRTHIQRAYNRLTAAVIDLERKLLS